MFADFADKGDRLGGGTEQGAGQGGEKREAGDGLVRRLLRKLMFVDLPIKRKFLLFALGTAFWFFFIAGVGVVSMTAIHYYYHQVSENSVPYRQAILAVMTKLHSLERDLALVLEAENSTVVQAGMESAREHAKGVRETVAALGLLQSEDQRFGTVVEQILQTMAKSNPEGRLYLQQMLELSGKLERELDQFYLGKRDALQGLSREAQDLLAAHGTVVARIQQAMELSAAHARRVDAEYRTINEQIYHIIRNSVHVILVVLVFAVALMLLFVRWIVVAFHQPIATIIDQIESLGTGDIDQAQKVVIHSRDEIGDLSQKFNALIDSVYGMTVYKKVIEEDGSLDEVYCRLGEVFHDDLELDRYMIYEVDGNKKEMRPAHPLTVGTDALCCHEEILSDSTLCRAVKTGRNISSFEYPGICRQFKAEEGQGHVCMPLLLSGKTGGVVQFVLPAAAPKAKLEQATARKLFKAETYINQSLSVIEAKRLMNTLRDSAMIDPLTGLYNRRFLQDHGKQLLSGVVRRNKQVGLLICDLDYFKQINDNHGHDVGDQVLKELAVVLRNTVREADVVIRFGGEEFLLLLLDIDPGESMVVAEKIRQRVEQLQVRAGEAVLKKTISIGVSEFPGDSDGFWQAIKYADVALYRAKEEGRNRVVRFTPEMWTKNDF